MNPLDPNTYFLQQGVLGVIIVVLIGLAGWQQRRYDSMVKEKDTEIKRLYEAINAVQISRIQDNQEIMVSAVRSSQETTNAVLALKDSLKDGFSRVIELIRK